MWAWAELKKRVKSRNPKNLNELKQITIEEWNNIPKSFIQKLFRNFIKRCNKIIELKGGRLEPVHLKQIRKEMEVEDKERKKDEEIETNYNEEKEEKKKKMSQKLQK